MSSTKDPSKKGQINIELDDKVAEGTYSNLAIINHSVSEFVVDNILRKYSGLVGSPLWAK